MKPTTRKPTTADPLEVALRRALRDESDPALRAWIRRLLKGDAPSKGRAKA